jgi:hypothetical protein
MLANARIHRVRIRFLIYGASFPSPNARETEYFWLCEPCSGGMTVRLTREGRVATNRDWQMRYVMPSCRTQLSEPEEWGIHSHR